MLNAQNSAKSPIADNEHTAMYSPLPPPGEFYRVQHVYRTLSGLMYVARMLQEALRRNAIQIWLRLEEKLSAQLTDEVSREMHWYFM